MSPTNVRALFTACLLAGLFTAGSVAASDFDFIVVGPIEVGTASTALFQADFNDDAHLDLALSHPSEESLSLLFGDGTGGFATPKTLDVGLAVVSLSTADVDEDGNTDIVLGSSASQVALFLGDGGGGFVLHESFDTLSGVSYAATGDFNEDGHADFAVTQREVGPLGAAVLLFEGDGRGAFSGPVTVPAFDGPTELFVHDLDGDGHQDLVVGHGATLLPGGRVGALLGDGTGSFQLEAELAGAYAGSLAVSDLNLDGRLDLVLLSALGPFCDNVANVYLQDPNGAFTSVQIIEGVCGPHTVVVADFDQDSFDDLLVTDGGDFVPAVNGILIYHGDGSGIFFDPSTFGSLFYSLVSPAPGDFDEDGRVDFAAIGFFDDVYVHLNRSPSQSFLRGDADANGDFNGLTDAVFILRSQFVPGNPEPPCSDAADVDDDGAVSGLLDALSALNFQFLPGFPPPPDPGPTTCGFDPTPDVLRCAAYAGCP